MRPLGAWLYWWYLTLSLKEPKNAFWAKSPSHHKNFYIKNHPKTRFCIVFYLRNEFHENRMNFGEVGKKTFFMSISTYFEPPWIKNLKFWSKLILKNWKIGYVPIFVSGIRKNWSREDLSTPPPQNTARDVFADIVS